ncbi:hypothetical protein [Variovorax sp. SRS16]|uniref:hypothetical protein n=1 Tax=Variovorax sp. SRS16 TaxID=282217 RepID=UPI001E53DC11|nr:hypothetical protein [Variovorax sp. SRS16]
MNPTANLVSPTEVLGSGGSLSQVGKAHLESLQMVRFRAILLWLVMIAVPFQGYAAAAMVFCETGAVPEALLVGASHDHAKHDHGVADHATANHAKADSGSSVHSDPAARAEHVDHVDVGDLPDSSHACGTCGTCSACHAVALTTTLSAIESYSLPQADLAEPSGVMATVSPSVLDKPPRP